MYHIIIVDSVLAKKKNLNFFFLNFFLYIFLKIDAHPKVRTRAVRVYWDIYVKSKILFDKFL